MQIKHLIISLCILILSGCGSPNPNTTKSGEDELKSLELDRSLSNKDMNFEDVVYVPIYSDIYVDKLNQNSLLSSTLSIRNTSLSDSIYVPVIDYYNTEGVLVKSFIEQPIALPPMATVNYVIEREDTLGGPGANFIVKLFSNKDVKPIIQSVMIGEIGNKGFAFSTDGYSIK